jgi:rhomboid protease GluP
MTDRGSILCPRCKKLISDYVEECPHCNLKNPARKEAIFSRLMIFRRSYVKVIISITAVFLVVSYLIPFFISIDVPTGRDMFGLIPSPSSVSLNLLGWADIRLVLAGNWWVLVTAIFLHGGILHILFNMLWVRDLAPQVEILFGPHNMLTLYVLSGIGGNLVALFSPIILNMLFGLRMPSYPVVGASGAVFGLMGAMIAFGRKRGGFFGRQMARQIGMWALILIVMGFLFPGISNAAHIGGFVTGLLVAYLLFLQKNPAQSTVATIIAIIVSGICLLSFLMMAMRLVQIVARL